MLINIGGPMRLSVRVLCIGGFIAASALAGCSNKITEEQLAMIKELRKKEQSLNEEIGKKEQELKRVQSEVNARKADMNKCNDRKAFVQDKLSRWPNIWPDYVEAEVTKDTVNTTTTRRPQRP